MLSKRVLAGVVCFVAATAALACATEVRIAATRQVRVVVVEGEKTAFARDLAARFGERIDGASGTSARHGATARMEHASARDAAERVKGGACDAILFVGADRPGALRSLDACTLAALCGHVLAPTPVYLIVPNGDPERKRVLGAAFAAAVGDMPTRERVAASE